MTSPVDSATPTVGLELEDRAARRARFRKALLLAGLGLVVVGALALLAAVLWALDAAEPGAAARAALSSDGDSEVEIIVDDGYVFWPGSAGDGPDTGLVLYPGARVDPVSYAPVARRIAAAGYLVVVPEVTLNLAVLDRDAADDVIDRFPEVDTWVVGGHSLGGAMAADYAHDHDEALAGLVLWAAYPPDSNDLSSSDLLVTSVFATNDGLTTVDEIEDSGDLLPTGTAFVAIAGGNHAQFGDYGRQAGDQAATIPPEQQWTLVAETTIDLLERVGAGG